MAPREAATPGPPTPLCRALCQSSRLDPPCALSYICFLDMLEHMRTTLNIDIQLMALVKKRAAESGKTITEIVEEALRKEVSGIASSRSPFALKWQPVRGPVQPGVDISDRDSLYGVMERP